MGESGAAVGRIFISYRREDTAYPAGWLFDRLTEHFDAGQVFKDVDSIELGDDFVEAISTAVGSCDVLLALIGDQWLTITDDGGRRRLEDPDDFVRVEIEAALSRNVRVIPILVDGATMPRTDDVPPSLAGLIRRQALELSPSRFDFDSGRLLNVLDKTLIDVRTEDGEAKRKAPDSQAKRTTTAQPESSTQAVGVSQARAGSAPTTPGVSPTEAGTHASAHRRRKWLRAGVLAAIAGLGLIVIAVLIAPDETENSLEASAVLFEDDFSSRSTGWKEDGRESALTDIVDGRYHIQVVKGRDTDFAWISPESSKALFPTTSTNLAIQVDAQIVSGGSHPSDSYGIFCRSSYGEHDYRFDVGNQKLIIFKHDAGEIVELESETLPASLDLAESNDIQASCRTIEQGGAVLLELTMNGDKLIDATDRDNPHLAGTIGMYAYTLGMLEVEFDNLTVNEL